MLDNHKKLLETQRKIRGQPSQKRERFMQVKFHPVLGFCNKKQLYIGPEIDNAAASRSSFCTSLATSANSSPFLQLQCLLV